MTLGALYTFHGVHGRGCLIEQFLNLLVALCGGVACHFTLVDYVDEGVGEILRCAVLGEFAVDVVARELRCLQTELVAQIAPYSTEHLLVELVVVMSRHESLGNLESLFGDFVGVGEPTALNVGVELNLLAVNPYYCHEDEGEHYIGRPVPCRRVEVTVYLRGVQVAHLYVEDVGVFA